MYLHKYLKTYSKHHLSSRGGVLNWDSTQNISIQKPLDVIWFSLFPPMPHMSFIYFLWDRHLCGKMVIFIVFYSCGERKNCMEELKERLGWVRWEKKSSSDIYSWFQTEINFDHMKNPSDMLHCFSSHMIDIVYF